MAVSDKEKAELMALVAEGIKQGVVEIEKAKLAASEKVDAAAAQEAKDNAELAAQRKAACPKCHQPKRGCGYKETTLPDGKKVDNDAEVHERLVMRPNEEMLAKYWPGVQLNGVVYFSSSGRESVVVPKNAQLMTFVRNYEKHEMISAMGHDRAPKQARPVTLSA